MIAIMLGAPGTGKGTMSRYMSEYYGIPHISTGDILREIAKEDTLYGKEIKKYIDKGMLVPDEYLNDLLTDRLKEDDTKDGYILDGYPRTMGQVEFFEKYLENNSENLTAVINLETPREELIDRIVNRIICPKCKAIYNKKYNPPVIEGHCDVCDTELVHREDDTPEKVIDRLEIYEKETSKLLEHYKKTEKMFTVLVCDKADKMGGEVLKSIVWFIEKKEEEI